MPEHDRERCRELAERLSEYLDDELPTDLRREVRDHFESCSTCEKFMRSLRRVRDLGPLLPERTLSDDALRRVTEAVKRKLAAD